MNDDDPDRWMFLVAVILVAAIGLGMFGSTMLWEWLH